MTTLFSTDPDVLEAVTEVNGYRVVARGSGPSGTYVLCERDSDEYQRWVTWLIWRTDDGKIAATAGHYHRTLVEASVDLGERVGQ